MMAQALLSCKDDEMIPVYCSQRHEQTHDPGMFRSEYHSILVQRLLPNAVHMLYFSKRLLFCQQETLSSSKFFCLRQVEHVISVLQTHVIRVPF